MHEHRLAGGDRRQHGTRPTVEVVDHKVTRWRTTPDALVDDVQVNLYGTLVRRRWPETPEVRGTLHYPMTPDAQRRHRLHARPGRALRPLPLATPLPSRVRKPPVPRDRDVLRCGVPAGP